VPASGFNIDDGFILEEYPQGVEISFGFTRNMQYEHQQEQKF